MYFPITLYSSVMGITGLSIAYQRTEQFFPLVRGIGLGLLYLAFCLFAGISVLYFIKIMFYPEEALKEFNHPVRFNFFPAVSVSLLLLAIGSMELYPVLANGLWMIGATAHLAFTLTAVSRWISREYTITQLNPAWIIPVVGNVLVPIAGVQFAPQEISWFFFSIGMFFYMALFALLLYRLGFHAHLPEKLLPTLFILIAPPAVGFISYTRLTGSFDPTARLLLYVAIFTTLLLFVMYKKFIRLPFFLSWWAYTFPLCALTLALITAFRLSQLEFFKILAGFILTAVTIIVLVVAVKTLRLALLRELCVPEE